MAITTTPIEDGKSNDDLAAQLAERFGAPSIHSVVRIRSTDCQSIRSSVSLTALRDEAELQFDTLIEITGIDHLSFPGWREERFAVVYILKSTVFRHRHAEGAGRGRRSRRANRSEVYCNANWLERETYDQYGINFVGHPNLKRLLNHRAFVGHPLRKDYPVQKRQHLDYNDPMVDELVAVLGRFSWIHRPRSRGGSG